MHDTWHFFFTVSVLLFASPANQVSANEDVPRPRHQTSQGDSPDDVSCEEGSVSVWNKNGTQECVKPENVLKLIRSG